MSTFSWIFDYFRVFEEKKCKKGKKRQQKANLTGIWVKNVR